MKKFLKNIYLKRSLLLLPAFLIIFCSCIGVSANVQMNADGSGRVTMEYRISKMLDSIGMLDGNASMPPVPVSRTDWERTVSRIPDTRLVSYSRKETSNDIIVNAVIGFNNPQALALVLCASNDMVSVNVSGQSNNFDIIFTNGSNQYDADFLKLMQGVFADCNFSFSFNAPRNSTLTFTDARGNAASAPASAAAVTSGRNVSVSMNILDLLNYTNGLGVRISW